MCTAADLTQLELVDRALRECGCLIRVALDQPRREDVRAEKVSDHSNHLRLRYIVEIVTSDQVPNMILVKCGLAAVTSAAQPERSQLAREPFAD